MDDFYLPARQMAKAMLGNPWNVPRALPGSHSIQLLEDNIDLWMENGLFDSPQFDKAMRNGMGDRSGWRRIKPQVLVIEGWFLGCSTTDNHLQINNHDELNVIICTVDLSNFVLNALCFCA